MRGTTWMHDGGGLSRECEADASRRLFHSVPGFGPTARGCSKVLRALSEPGATNCNSAAPELIGCRRLAHDTVWGRVRRIDRLHVQSWHPPVSWPRDSAAPRSPPRAMRCGRIVIAPQLHDHVVRSGEPTSFIEVDETRYPKSVAEVWRRNNAGPPIPRNSPQRSNAFSSPPQYRPVRQSVLWAFHSET